MNFVEISDRFPRLEYLFGAFFQRYSRSVQIDSKRVLSEFICRNPAACDETAAQLFEVIEYCARQLRPEEAALEFLEALNCPYYPPYYGSAAIVWFRDVYATLGWPRDSKPLATDRENLDLPDSLVVSVLPLLPIYVLLFSHDMPLVLASRLKAKTASLLTVRAPITKTKPLRGPTELSGDVIPISTPTTPLKEVLAWKTLS